MELCSVLFDEPGCFQFREYANFVENCAIVRKQRLPDMKSREVLFLQNQNAPSCFCQIAGRSAPSRATADDQRVVLRFHTEIKQHCCATNKSGERQTQNATRP